MVKLKHFTAGLLLGFLPMGCAGVSYHYYGLNAEHYEGTLLGPKAKDDKPFSVCTPNAQSKSPCVVMMQDEYFRMYQELLSARQALIDCQKPMKGTL